MIPVDRGHDLCRPSHSVIGRTALAKTNWKDIGDLRRPNPAWRLGRAAAYFARLLEVNEGAVLFVNPDGSRARSNKTLGSLRADWEAFQLSRRR